MRLYYSDESESPTLYVRTAIGINEEDWNNAFLLIQDWRKEISRLYSIPLFKELHASDLLARRGKIVRKGKKYSRIKSMEDAVAIFVSGIQTLEKMSASLSGGLDIINVCLKKEKGNNREADTLNRLLTRINTSVSRDIPSHRAFLIFDEGKEKKTSYFYRKMRVYNPVMSKYGQWDNGNLWKNFPIKNIVGGIAFRTSAGDYFLQLADFVAYALLKREDSARIDRILSYKINEVFEILDNALNKKASEDDPKGIVRH